MNPIFRLFVVLGVALVTAGCSLTADWPEPERTAAIAAGVPGAIRIEVEGGPVDVPDQAANPLPLADAARRALATHPGIQAALSRARLAQADAQQSRLLPNPIVTVVLRFPEAGGKPVIEAGIAAELLSLLQQPGRVSAADHRVRAAGAEATKVVLDVLTETQTRYVAVQALDALLPVLEKRRQLLAQSLGVAKSRLDAGEGIRLDVTTLECHRVELEVEAAERMQERLVHRLALARLIGEPSGEVTWNLEPWMPPSGPREPESAWIATALERRPEIQARHSELAALGVEVNLSRLALLDKSEAGVNGERDGRWSVGPSIAVPIPLFDWGQAKRAGAEARRLEAMHELTTERRRVVEEVRRAYSTYSFCVSAVSKLRDELLPRLELRYRDAESAYKAGEAAIVPLLLADEDLQAGRAKLIELQRKLGESVIELHRAVGGPGNVPSLPTNTDLNAIPKGTHP